MTPEEQKQLIATAEGKILIAGMLLLMAYLGVLVFCALFFPDFYELMSAVIVGNVLVGRVPGITVSYAMDASFYSAVGLNFIVETILVLLLYPLFIMSWNKLLHIGPLEAWIARARLNALKYRPLIEKYGRIGLFIFVWIPFWMTGPIIGSIIGYLMGFRHRTTLFIVLTGTLIAISCWGLGLRHLHEWAFSVDPTAPWIIFGLMVLLVMLGFIIRKIFKR